MWSCHGAENAVAGAAARSTCSSPSTARRTAMPSSYGLRSSASPARSSALEEVQHQLADQVGPGDVGQVGRAGHQREPGAGDAGRRSARRARAGSPRRRSPAMTSVGAPMPGEVGPQVHRLDRGAAAGVALGRRGQQHRAQIRATHVGLAAREVGREPPGQHRVGDGRQPVRPYRRGPGRPQSPAGRAGPRCTAAPAGRPAPARGRPPHRDHAAQRQPAQVGPRRPRAGPAARARRRRGRPARTVPAVRATDRAHGGRSGPPGTAAASAGIWGSHSRPVVPSEEPEHQDRCLGRTVHCVVKRHGCHARASFARCGERPSH